VIRKSDNQARVVKRIVDQEINKLKRTLPNTTEIDRPRHFSVGVGVSGSAGSSVSDGMTTAVVPGTTPGSFVDVIQPRIAPGAGLHMYNDATNNTIVITADAITDPSYWMGY
jgi:hypothetical protein